MASGGSRRPGTKSLWLLPSGPDQVGDSAVRRLPSPDMVEGYTLRKFMLKRACLHRRFTRGGGLEQDNSRVSQIPPPLFLFALIAPAAQLPVSPSTPIPVTGHPWAPFISPMGEP